MMIVLRRPLLRSRKRSKTERKDNAALKGSDKAIQRCREQEEEGNGRAKEVMKLV